MKIIKKITGVLFVACVMLNIMLVEVHAATGRVSFTDLNTSAGEEFTITIRTKAEGVNIDTIKMELEYDASIIEFLSGDSITAAENTLVIEETNDIESADIALEATFMALKEAETNITIKSLSVIDTDGSEIEMVEGKSAINIVGGTEVEPSGTTNTQDTKVTVEGEEYTISSNFEESSLPMGYQKSTLMYNNQEYVAAKSEIGDSTLVLLIDQAGEGEFFQYNENDATFSPFVRVNISDTSYIVFSDKPITLELPEQYIEKTLTINEFIFPTWEDTKNEGFYLIHAYDNNGQLGVYQYDTVQQTYQRYSAPVEEANPAEIQSDFQQVVSENIVILSIVISIIFIILLAIIIMLLIRISKLKSKSSKYDREHLDSMYEKPSRYAKAGKTSTEYDNTTDFDDYDDSFEDEYEFENDDEDEYEFENDDENEDEFENEVTYEYEDEIDDEDESVEYEVEYEYEVEDDDVGEQDVKIYKPESKITTKAQESNVLYADDEFENEEYYAQLEEEYVDNGFDDSYQDTYEFEDEYKQELEEFNDTFDQDDDDFDESEYEIVETLLDEEQEAPRRNRRSVRRSKK